MIAMTFVTFGNVFRSNFSKSSAKTGDKISSTNVTNWTNNLNEDKEIFGAFAEFVVFVSYQRRDLEIGLAH